MAKTIKTPQQSGHGRREAKLRDLQIELVKVQKHVIKHDHKVLVIFEGRDASGKDGTIKRIVEHLSPRESRVVALGKPSDRDSTSWYFQRYVSHLPAAQELVLFNRSWYNRAGVERVMKFCTNREYERFVEDVLPFEHMLIGAGIQILKYYLDISKKEQKRRLRDRRHDPLKQWKDNSIDKVALEHWTPEARQYIEREASSVPGLQWRRERWLILLITLAAAAWATGGTSDRDGGIAVRLRTADNYYLVPLDALTNRVLFSLVTHGVPEDRRRQCGYSFAHLV